MAPTPQPRPVLLIDDSHEDLFLAKRLIARGGVTAPIVTVDGGDEAIVFLHAAALPGAAELLPLVIFCDIKMPGRNGFDVLQWIRGEKALASVPVYILSGSDLEMDRKRAHELGATGYLVKYPTAEAFKAIIDQAVTVASSSLPPASDSA